MNKSMTVRVAAVSLSLVLGLMISPVDAEETLGGISRSHAQADWLIDPSSYRATVSENDKTLTLENGLTRRAIVLAPNAATVDLQNLTSGEHVLRAIAPEARLTIDGTEYAIGG